MTTKTLSQLREIAEKLERAHQITPPDILVLCDRAARAIRRAEKALEKDKKAA
jgi:hypothetical protein